MKFIIIGLGSMGKRRIRLLKEHHKNIELIGVDSRLDRRNEVNKNYSIKTYENIIEAIEIEKPNSAFICTSPISHSDLIIECLNNNLNIFTEINLLSDRYEEIINLAKEKNLKLFLSSTFLYRKEIEIIKEKCEDNILNYRYHVGQYLPDWHPWESYKDFFVGDKKTNGCRELLAIEFPWIIDTFGEIVELNIFKNNLTTLEIDYPDNYSIIIKHKNGSIGNVNVDVVSRKAIRSLEIYNENLHLFWDGKPDTLREYNLQSDEIEYINTYDKVENDSRYSENIIENAYLEEIGTFINYLNNDKSNVKYSFEKDLYTLSMIDKIEGE